MKLLKTLTVPFLSFALIFSSHPILAQNLVDTIPAFYYLEDARDGFFSVHACSASTTEGDSVKALNCPIVAEVSKSDLENFLADFSREAEDQLAQVESDYRIPNYAYFGAVAVSSVGLISLVLKYPPASTVPKMAKMIFLGSMATLVAGFIGSATTNSTLESANKEYESQQNIEREIRSGVVGYSPDNREAILQQFTDFLNQYGVRPNTQASAP